MNIRFTAAALGFALMATIATAQPAAPNMKQACAADAAKLCPGMTKGTGLMKCMKSHMADVSPDCNSAIMSHMDAMKAKKDAGAMAPDQGAMAPSPH